MTLDIGPIGIWSASQPWRDRPEAAAELEELGFGALWLGGSPDGDLRLPESVLGASGRLTVGTSIVNVWKDEAAAVAAGYRRLASAHPGRFILGLGIGHAPIDAAYNRPMRKLGQYLDELDAATPPVPVSGRAIAALGPRALQMARDRSLGSLPYNTTPEHTRTARTVLGPGALLVPEQKVVLDDDPERAREIARRVIAFYMALPNYVNSWRRLGFDDGDLAAGGSDRFVDAVIAWGPDAIRARVEAHLDAGADQVALQVLTGEGQVSSRVPVAEFRELAAIVSGVRVRAR